MSPRENFVARWSRRKRAGGTPAAASDAPPTEAAAIWEAQSNDALQDEPHVPAGHASPESKHGPEGSAVEHSFDLTKLPPIESIAAKSDIRAFLAPGVPVELTRAALRRAWSADPQIRDFIGLAENSWDFNAPDAMGGFGPLEISDEMRHEILRMVGRTLDAAADGPEPCATDVPHGLKAQAEASTAAASPDPAAAVTESEDTAALATHNRPISPAAGFSAAPQSRSRPERAAGATVSTDPATTAPAPRLKRQHGGALPE